MESKPFYTSKTFWVNLLALVSAVLQYYFGWVFEAELQAAVLAVINLALRAVTHKPISWSNTGPGASLLLVVFLSALCVIGTGCAGLQVCDELAIVMTDTNVPDKTKVLMLCDGTTIAEIETNQVFGEPEGRTPRGTTHRPGVTGDAGAADLPPASRSSHGPEVSE